MKPFKPPTVVGLPNNTTPPRKRSIGPPAKKRRISPDDEEDQVETVAAAARVLKQSQTYAPLRFQVPARRPLDVIPNPSSSLPSSSQAEGAAEGYYTVLW